MNVAFILAAVGVCVGLCVAAGPATRPAESFFDDLKWKRRVLVVSAPSDHDGDLLRQRAAIAADRAGVAERDLTVIELVGPKVTVDGRPIDVPADAVREHLKIAAGRFAVVLVGKDGGVKRRETAVLPMAELFGTIDAMPMRQNEKADRP